MSLVTCVAIEVFTCIGVYLTRTGLYLSVKYYVTCVNLLFSNSRVQSYI